MIDHRRYIHNLSRFEKTVRLERDPVHVFIITFLCSSNIYVIFHIFTRRRLLYIKMFEKPKLVYEIERRYGIERAVCCKQDFTL